MILGGYAGKVLFVDLTSGDIEEKPLSEAIAVKYVGGYGIGARILYRMMAKGAAPLGPDNVLGFVPRPLNATNALFSGRYAVVCKSPITGGWNDANSGGFFGPQLKKAGFDGFFVSGVSKKPVYLFVRDGKAEIRDAEHIRGKDCTEAHETLVQDTGAPSLRVARIGPGGEKQSLTACIINDRHRAAARGKCGAIMGSKHLKAIADRKGLGAILAHGSGNAADTLKKGEEYLQTVRGIELPMHDPGSSPYLARTYQCDPTPGRHVKGGLGIADLDVPEEIRFRPEGRGKDYAETTCAFD